MARSRLSASARSGAFTNHARTLPAVGANRPPRGDGAYWWGVSEPRRPETAQWTTPSSTTTTTRPRPRPPPGTRCTPITARTVVTAITRARWSWRPRRARPRCVPAPVLVRAGADHPGRLLERRGPGVARLPGTSLPGLGVDPAGARHGHLRLRRARISEGCARRAAQPAARDDDPHLAGDRGRLRGVLGGDAWASSRSTYGGSSRP